MTEPIYNTFKESGFEKEARYLSTTVIDAKGNQKKVTGLGHYIAILDNMLELDKIMPNRPDNPKRTKYFNESANHVLEGSAQFDSDLLDKIKDILYHGKVNK
jgi:hypothetical protein